MYVNMMFSAYVARTVITQYTMLRRLFATQRECALVVKVLLINAREERLLGMTSGHVLFWRPGGSDPSL